MKLAIFRENTPFQITEFPFDDMYFTEMKFIKIGRRNLDWLGILVGNYNNEIISASLVLSDIGSFTSLQTNAPVTKDEIISYIYTKDLENKIVRDAIAGRNLNVFNEYDQFVESIPAK